MPPTRPSASGRKRFKKEISEPVNRGSQLPVIPANLSSEHGVQKFLYRLLPAVGRKEPAAALLPWVCDRLVSPHSRKAYASDLARFVSHLRRQGIDPLNVTGDHVRVASCRITASAVASV